MSSRTVDVIWAVALLAAFVGMFRRAPQPEPTGTIGAEPCTGSADLGALERCLEADPANVELLTDLGDAYARLGRRDLAEAAYRRGLAVDPRDGDLHLRLADLLLERGDALDARGEAREALRWQPGSAAAGRRLALAEARP